MSFVLLILFFWGYALRLDAASVGTARISVFRQEGDTNRSVGSLIGVWNFKGRTFANQHSSPWMTHTTIGGISDDVRVVRIWKQNPAYAFSSGESDFGRFTGTTWLFDTLQSFNTGILSCMDVFNDRFAVVGQGSQDLWQWSGTSWLHPVDGSAANASFQNVNVLATDFAVAFGDSDVSALSEERAVLHWRGTTWRVHLTHPGNSRGSGAMVDTAFGWYFSHSPTVGTPSIYQWGGTSWQVFSGINTADGRVIVDAIPGERDFALAASINGSVWRWMGTSWLYEQLTASNFNDIAIVQTDHAWIVGSLGNVWQWTGTSWVSHILSSSSLFNSVSAVRTDYALVTASTNAVLWSWRGTSWVLVPASDLETSFGWNSVDTVGETLTIVGGLRKNLVSRQMVNVRDDAIGIGTPPSSSWGGTVYRTVVQVLPTDSDWDWVGASSDTNSYFGVLNKDGNSYEFAKENETTASGRQIVVTTGSLSLGVVNNPDTFIWEDTVGLWDGFSESPHNNNASTGIRLVEAGNVHGDAGGALPADVWGETDGRATSSPVDLDSLSWANAAEDTTVTANSGWLTWEVWHLFDAGFRQGEEIETAIHVKAGGSSTDLAGISWKYRVGHYRPRIGNWRWCKDDAAEPTIIKEPGGRLTDVSPNGERLRLRVRIDETNGGWMASATGDSGWTLWYSTDQASWTQLTTSSSVWFLYNGQGASGSAVSGASLPGVDTLGIRVERHTAQNGFKQEPFTEAEMDFAIQSTAAAAGTIYYFEARNNGHRALPKPGVAYPSVRTTDDTTHNYVYTRPELGRFSRPMVNPAVAAGGNGDPFKVVYVATQGGSGDQLFAISRTDGGLVRSFSASGTLEHGNLYWDSTNSRYNLFFRQGNSSILALKDDGGTITTNGSWASNPLSFTNLIGRPVRVFDGDKQNYLMMLVTSFQGNTSTLYKLRAADSTIVTDGNYSQKAQTIGVHPGLRVTAGLYPLWVDGTAYALGASAVGPYKIPQSGGTTPTVCTDSSGNTVNFSSIAGFGPFYTRDTITTGGRILFGQQGYNVGMLIANDDEGAVRLNDADMRGLSFWASNNFNGESQDIANSNGLTSGPYSPPFQSAFPVPVYIGDGTQINRLSGSTGVNENNYPQTLTGSVNTEIVSKGNWIYFGTSSGYIYALSTTDPDAPGGENAFRVPSGSAVVGVAIDSTNSLVYYTTQDGRIYQFDTR